MSENGVVNPLNPNPVVPFGFVADYVCDSGYFFGKDMNMSHFNLTWGAIQ